MFAFIHSQFAIKPMSKPAMQANNQAKHINWRHESGERDTEK